MSSEQVCCVEEASSLLDKRTRSVTACCSVRKLKSKGVIVTIVLFFLTWSAFCSLFQMSKELHGFVSQHNVQTLPGSVALFVLTLSCPVNGWLADVYFGRYKVIRAGLWLMWIAVLVGTITLVVLSQHQHEVNSILYQSVCTVGGFFGFIIFPVGFSAFTVNAVQFGMDQMPDASASEVSAYIHWLVWAIFAGLLVSDVAPLIYHCASIQDNPFLVGSVQILIPASLLSLALCCDFLLGGWLTIEPESQNPLRTIFGVLRFAATHSHPVGRSASTYWEQEKPSRLDFAKEKFHGPYSTEEVEDVKTFFRIVTVIISTVSFSIPLLLYIFAVDLVLGDNVDNSKEPHSECSEQSKSWLYLPEVFAVLIIPLYEFLVHPYMRDRLPSMLERVGIAAALTVVLCGIIFTTDIIERIIYRGTVCMLDTSSKVPAFNWILAPMEIVVAIQLVMYFIAILEFTCAQAPYSMRGSLIGLVNSITFISYPLAYIVFTTWRHYSTRLPSKSSCDFYYFLFQFLCAVVGLIVLCTVAKWYKRRQRDDPFCYQALVESIYERALDPSNVARKQTDYTYLN